MQLFAEARTQFCSSPSVWIWCVEGSWRVRCGIDGPPGLCQRPIPLFLQRPADPTPGPELELALTNTVRELDARQSHRCGPIGLQAQHRPAAALDSPGGLAQRCCSSTGNCAPGRSSSVGPLDEAGEVPSESAYDHPGDLARESGRADHNRFTEKAIAAAIPRVVWNSESTVFPCLSTARYR